MTLEIVANSQRANRRFFLEALVSGMLALPFIVACSQQQAPNPPQLGSRNSNRAPFQRISEPKPQEEQRKARTDIMGKDYIPLDEGNTLEYKITIPEGSDYYNHREFFGNGRGRTPKTAVGRMNKSGGVFILRYSLGMQAENRVRVNVEKDEPGFFKDARAVYINISPVGDPPHADRSSYLAWEVLKDEPMIHSKGFLFKLGMRNMDQEMIGTNNIDQVTFKITLDFENPFDVKVAAGSFGDCVKQVIAYYPQHMFSERERKLRESFHKKPSPMQTGWKEVGYFAPGVGLVKGAQYDHNGKELNTTELVSFKVRDRQ